MLKPAITAPLRKDEVRDLVNFIAHHLGYVPLKIPRVIFAKSAKYYANLYKGYVTRSKELSQEQIVEINSETPAFFDHLNDTVVFQGFSYVEGAEIDTFVIPMSTVVHEIIHFFQYATGTFSSYRVLYEGTNDILSCLLTDDPEHIDYPEEAVFAMSLAMEINQHNFFQAVQWMKTFTTHSDKNGFVHRSIRQCPSLAKYNPSKLMKMLDASNLDKIDNEETRAILSRYSLGKIKKLLRDGHKIISGVI